MTPARSRPAAHRTATDSTQAVDVFMATLEHPMKREVEAIRRLVLGVDATTAEGVKWNAPSYRTTEYFATTNLRDRGGIGVILHLGAKVRPLPSGGMPIDDPGGLLKWLAKDRASVTFRDGEELRQRQTAFEAILRQWIAYV